MIVTSSSDVKGTVSQSARTIRSSAQRSTPGLYLSKEERYAIALLNPSRDFLLYRMWPTANNRNERIPFGSLTTNILP